MSTLPFAAFICSVLVVAWLIAHRAPAILTLVLAVTTLLTGVQAAAAAGWMLVHTPSVPEGLYRRHAVERRALTAGAYVCVDAIAPTAPIALREGVQTGALPAAWRSEPLVKRIAATEGAYVTVADDGVRVNGEMLPMSAPAAADSTGRKLPRAASAVRLERAELWLRSEHPHGFDSRYFGPVSVAALTCVAEPVWTW